MKKWLWLIGLLMGVAIVFVFKWDHEVETLCVETNVISNSVFKLELLESKYLDKVSPDAPSGYYHYYPEKEGKHYLVIPLIVTNVSQKELKSEDFNVKVKVKNKWYEGLVLIKNEEKSDFVNQVNPEERLEGYLMALVPQKLKDETEESIQLSVEGIDHQLIIRYIIQRKGLK